MRFFDLLEDYYKKDNIWIKRYICQDLYYLVRNRGTMADELMLRMISKSEADGLKNNTISPSRFMYNTSDWVPLAWLEGLYTEEDLAELAKMIEEFKKEKLKEEESKREILQKEEPTKEEPKKRESLWRRFRRYLTTGWYVY